MMLEQTLINPNFAGRDGFKWFIGQVVAPESSRDNKLGCRAKVRILGHHPGDDQIKDENLPWAHVMMPLGLGSGTGYTGINPNFKGGEIVLGFFLDGDDAQQPIILGSLYESGYGLDKGKTFSEIIKLGTSEFKPFAGNFPNNAFSQPVSPNEVPGRGVPASDGKVFCVGVGTTAKFDEVESKGDVITNNQGTIVKVPSECTNGKRKFNEIQLALVKFIQFTNTIQIINNVYINPVLGTVANLDDELQKTASFISDILIGIFRETKKRLIEDIYFQLTTWLGTPGIPPTVKLATHSSVETVIDSIACAFEKILQKILDFVIDFLLQMVDAVLSIPFCAAESFVGELFGSISNAIEDLLGDSLDQITSLIGGGIGTVMSYVSKAAGLAQAALQLLSCENSACYENYDYEMNKGWIPSSNPDFQRILSYASATPIRNLQPGISSSVNNWFDSVGLGSSTGTGTYTINNSCDASIIECGFPTISLFGGDGFGASAEAVVDSAGQIMGAFITNGGTGYSSPPFVSVEDSCQNGGGASAYAETQDGVVTNIVITNSGNNYLGPQAEESPCSTYPSTQSGDPVSGSLNKVNILNTGIGYSATDTITDSNCPNDVLAQPIVDNDGRIVGVDIINPGTSINLYPNLQINSTTGEGAKLLPILTFKKIDELPKIETKVTKIKKVIYCAETNDI